MTVIRYNTTQSIIYINVDLPYTRFINRYIYNGVILLKVLSTLIYVVFSNVNTFFSHILDFLIVHRNRCDASNWVTFDLCHTFDILI